MNVLGTLLAPRGQRRGPRQLVRVTLGQAPKHAVPKPITDWFVTPQYDCCPETDGIGYDLLAMHQKPAAAVDPLTDIPADCGTPDPETAVA